MYFLLNICINCWSRRCFFFNRNIFAKGTATFINGPANLLTNELKNLRDWIISYICILHNFMSVDILFLIALLNLVVWLVASYNSWSKLFPLNILICILKFTTVWFLAAAFILFNRESANLTCTLYCIQPFIYSHKSFAVWW